MPVFAHGQLRLYLLALLESGPKHGYELITALSDRFGGTYRPSPGTVYPRLARLEEEGLVTRVDEGRKGMYALTDAGRAELAERRAASRIRRAEAEGLLQQFRDEVRADLRRADALGDVPPLTVDTVRTVLSSACTAIRATLNGPGH